MPVGQSTATPLPGPLFQFRLTELRYSVRLYVVPLLSERWMTVIARSGRALPLLSFLIAGSFHFLIWPRKMPATTFPLMWMWFGSASPLYAIAVAESAHGICAQPLQAASWSGVKGASLAPKSTVRFVTALMPPPEPIGPYVTLMPNCESTCGIQV